MKYKPSLEDHLWFITSLIVMLYCSPFLLLKEDHEEYKGWLALSASISLFFGGFFINVWFGFGVVGYVICWVWLFYRFDYNESLYYEWFTKRKPFVLNIGYFEYKRNGYLCHHYLEDNKRMKKWEQEDDE